MTTPTNAVFEEMKRFRESLPELLNDPELVGRWVVYKDGSVHSTHDAEDEAYRSALEEFGASGGFIVVAVEPIEPVALTAAALLA